MDGSDRRIEGLAAVCGPGELILDAEVCAPYGRDWTGRFTGRPAAVVRPATTERVARVVAYCAEQRLALVPQGGRTGLVGGSVPSDGQVVLSLERMRAVRRIDLDNGAIVVEAGATLAEVDEALGATGLAMPVDLASRASAQVGGLLATAAGGIRHVRDGALVSHVRGLEAVLGDGRVLSNLSTLEKNNTGYAWAQLLCGSEGTLGVITAAAVGLVPRAAAARTAWLTLAEAGAFARLVGRARALCLGSLAALEFIDRAAVDALREARPDLALPHPDAPWHVLVECEAATAAIAEAPLFALVEAALTDGLAVDAVVAQDERDRQRLWRLREALPEAIGRLGRVRRYDVAVAVPEVVGLVGAVRTALADGGLPARPVAYGHAAEGNVHLNVVVAAAPDTALEAALDAVVYGEVLARGGTISAEHGVGRLKRDHLGAMRSPAELAFMTALKALCDPAGILNPDVLLPPGEGRS